jgi:hypothetical protein
MESLIVALLNSLFWDYDSIEHHSIDGSLNISIIDALYNRIEVERMVYRHLTLIADHYKHRRHRYSGEKVILEQSLAALADIAHNLGIKCNYALVTYILTHELHEWVTDISVFESDDETLIHTRSFNNPQNPKQIALQLSIHHTLAYLDSIQRDGRIISHKEYISLIDEIIDLLSTKSLPKNIKPLALQPNGALLSGYSYLFVSYGISLIYRRNSLPRQVWINYLCAKICRPKSALECKFTLRPTAWDNKIITNKP